jgi:hypothetical protein
VERRDALCFSTAFQDFSTETQGPQERCPPKQKVESGTSQSKSGTSINLSNHGDLGKEVAGGLGGKLRPHAPQNLPATEKKIVTHASQTKVFTPASNA